MNAPLTPQNSGLAIASLVLGIVGLLTFAVCIGGVPALMAVIFGHMALARIKTTSGTVKGRGLALAGLVTGYAALVGLVLLIICTPWMGTPSQAGKMTGTLSNGRQIFIAHFGRVLDTPTNDLSGGWPQSGEFSTSTAFFTNLVASGGMKVDFSFFAADGLPACKSTNAAQFKAGNNAWCVVADLKDSDPDQTPFLFTRNLRINSLAEFKGPDQVSAEPPFGRAGVLVIFKGGSVMKFKPDQLASNFNCCGATNRVLRP